MIKTKVITGSDGQFEATGVESCRLRDGASIEDMRSDLAKLEQHCEPARERDVSREVARLAIRTKSRVHGDGEAALLAETLVDDLRRYPIDVVRFACQYWIEGGRDAKWMPSWPELREICERRVGGRLALRRCLELAVRSSTSTPPRTFPDSR